MANTVSWQVNIQTNTAKINELEISLTKVNARRKELLKTAQTETGITAKERKELANLTVESEKLKQKKTLLTNETKKAITANKAATGSIQQQRAALSVVSAQWAALSKSQRTNTTRGKELTRQKKELTASLKEEEAATGDSRRSVGDYTGGIKSALASMGPFGRVISMVVVQLEAQTAATTAQTTAQKGMNTATNVGTKALKVFKIALASTGIGAILVAIGSLIAYFQRTEEGAAKLQQILAPFKVLFGNLGDLMGDLGEALVSAFENPQQAVTDLWEFIKTNLLNRVTGIVDTFKFLGKTISAAIRLDWDAVKENAAAVGESVAQTLTGVDDVFNKLSESVGNLIEETKAETAALVELEQQKLAMLKREREINIQIANLRRDIADARLKAKDEENLSDAERLAALNIGIEKVKELQMLEDEIAKKKLAFRVLENSLSDSSQEDLDAENALRVALIEVQTAAARQLLRLDTERQILIKKVTAALQEQAIATMELVGAGKTHQETAEETMVMRTEYTGKTAAQIQKLGDLEETKAENALAFSNLALKGATSNLKKEGIAAKAAAIGSIILNTAMAIMKTAGQLGIFSLPAQIAMGILGAVQASKAAGVSFSRGGKLEGDSHDRGGIPFTVDGRSGFEAEGGEVLINKRSAAAFAPELSAINAYNGYGVRFADGGPVPSVSATGSRSAAMSQAAGMSKDMADYIIAGINDKKVINDPMEALEAQNFSTKVQNTGDF